MNADRTKNFTLIYSVDINDPSVDTNNFPFEHLITILSAIIDSCKFLERFYVCFDLCGEFSDSDFVVLSNWLPAIIKRLETNTLLKIECNCELIVAFHAFFPESTLLVNFFIYFLL